MADNYIERQYEQYEARKAAWEKARKLGKKKVKARYRQDRSATPSPSSSVLGA